MIKYGQINKDRTGAREKQYRANPEVKKKKVEYLKLYREVNKEKIREYNQRPEVRARRNELQRARRHVKKGCSSVI
jgi:hypothetical protein